MNPATIVPSMNPQRDTSAASLASQPQLKPDPTKIVVPRRHGQILIEPALDALAPALQGTRDFSGVTLDGIPWKTLRSDVRSHVLGIVQKQAPAASVDQPWVFTGHQVEFYHCGVWAKVLAVDELARRTGALPIDMLVDHDLVDHLGFDVPFPADDARPLTRRLITWADTPDTATDAIPAPSSKALSQFLSEVAESPLAHTDTMALIRPEFEKRAGGDYVAFVTEARRTMEQTLGISVPRLTSSAICSSLAWHHFVLAWARNARQWTAVYNRRLQDYRNRQKIKNPAQPMPNLQQTGESIELPFWIYRLGEPRQRLKLSASGSLSYGSETLNLLPAIGDITLNGAAILRQLLERHHIVVRPRALTLMMFVRLFLADVFIHGIGGALYDQITDDIFQDLLGIRPPYGCVSAAWLLPLGQAKQADHIPALRSQRHHLTHNPQQAINALVAVRTDVAELIKERRDTIERLRSSLATGRRAGRATRQGLFRRLHDINALLHEKCPETLATLDQQIATAVEQRQLNKVLLHREYFWALHSLASLRELNERLRSQ